jgi:Zn-dependent protease/predicted transcriptional regulator
MDPSLLLIAALLTLSLWVQFSDPRLFPSTSQPLAATLAIATAVLFFLSILAHELAHAGLCRLRKIPVEGITLFFFGGATHARIDAHGPGDEFLVTAGGPLTSLGVGGLFLLLRSAVGDAAGSEVERVFDYLGRINVLLGVFNLLPGFPLDGGRLLRSAVWKATGSVATGTKVAARGGQIVGGVLGVAGLILAASTGDIGNAWFALIGWFLFRSASEALVDVDRRRMLETTVARDVMSAPPPTIPADLPLGEAVERYLEDHDGEAFPVVEDGKVIGFVSMRTADGKRVDQPVREALGALGDTVVAGPNDRLDQITDRLQDARVQAVLVMEDGQLIGVIEPGDLNRFFRRTPAAPLRPD